MVAMGIGRSGVPSAKCKGRTVIRHSRDHEDPDLRGQPILDEDGARQYRPCEAWAANGTEYCGGHGGSAPQTIAAAKRTLSLGALEFAEALRAIAKDERIPAETRLKAINSGLDRIGLRGGIDVGLEIPAWQKMLEEEFGQSPEDEPSPPAKETVEAPAKEQAPRRATKKAAPSRERPKFEGW